MTYYRKVGQLPSKRHLQMWREDGVLYKEELMGVEGFSSDSSLLYHRYQPTALLAVDPVEAITAEGGVRSNYPLLPRHYKTHDVALSADLVTGRTLIAGNADVRVSYACVDGASPLYRNAIGDELVYIEQGSARLESVFGVLEAVAGDYVVIPTSTTHRWIPTSIEQVRALIIEASGHIRPPSRYLSQFGQLLEHAPYSERDFKVVEGPLLVEEDGPTEVLVKHQAGISKHTYLHHPFDVVGWDGCLYPYAFSIHDFEPIVKRTHMPPPIHQTWEGPNFVVCSFCPRPFDFDPEAVPVPYYHANVDSDELVMWLNTDPMSKKYGGIEPGSITLHPNGFIHGPQPGRTEMALGKPETHELFVMVDTFRPLHLGESATGIEDTTYAWSWANGEQRIRDEDS